MSKKQKEFIIMDVLILSYGDSYHIEFLSYRICTNQWTGFYMIGTFVMKELTGQITADVIDCYKKNNICDVLDDMTKYYHSIDLTVNSFITEVPIM